MDSVWVLMAGAQYEGGHLISVHATEASARQAAQSVTPKRYGWRLHREEPNLVIWLDGGCDWVEISQRKVQP